MEEGWVAIKEMFRESNLRRRRNEGVLQLYFLSLRLIFLFFRDHLK